MKYKSHIYFAYISQQTLKKRTFTYSNHQILTICTEKSNTGLLAFFFIFLLFIHECAISYFCSCYTYTYIFCSMFNLFECMILFALQFFVWCIFLLYHPMVQLQMDPGNFFTLLTVEQTFHDLMPFSIMVDFFSIKNCKDKCYL